MDLRGRTVILTGATGGIGSALCAELVAAGARVVAVGRSPGAVGALAGRFPAGCVVPAIADLASAQGRARLLEICGQLQPAPSLLVLGHARAGFGLFEDQTDQAIEVLLQTNVVGSVLLVRTLVPMLRQQPQAAVVVIGSTFGSLAFPGFSVYSASKFALRGLTEALSREYADTGLRFQYLAPRATRTSFNSDAVDALNRELKTSVDMPDEVARQLIAAIARQRPRLQLGWSERLFARINGLLPGLVDRSLRTQLPVIRRHASHHHSFSQEMSSHEAHSP
ncbi:SDR family oxidoreductase [Pseudoxanthomonas composti]|uniref:SDR family oxidoreductase n=1 Tax=Pseudoxanthomonas composti TaxID=2137479 RepID=A0A4Q1JXK2_9GAMM|nr:SDR family oxidoreductase [Pseudoxanthomonas composti]RXR07414.1 SDR family oxidoreductase [Pseudoxanthomonas composti]